MADIAIPSTRGTGLPRTTKTRCLECNGTGYAEQPVPTFTFGNDCPVCRGNGWLNIPSAKG